MPLITKLVRMDTTSGSLHPTQVEARFKVFERDGHGPILQIDTGGSQTRENPGKVSQTFQLSRTSAEALWKLLGETFHLK